MRPFLALKYNQYFFNFLLTFISWTFSDKLQIVHFTYAFYLFELLHVISYAFLIRVFIIRLFFIFVNSIFKFYALAIHIFLCYTVREVNK